MAETTTAAGRRVTRNTVSLLGARAITALASLVSLPVVYERLGPREFGVWILLNGLVAVLALVDLGLGSALVREVAANGTGPDQRRTRAVLGLGLGWAVCLGFTALAATVACWPWLVRLLHFGELAVEARHAAVALLVGLLFDGVALPWRAVLEGSQRYGTIAWTTGGTALLGAGLAVAVVRLGGGLAALAASAAATSAVRTLLTVAVARRHQPHLSPRLRDLRRSDLRVVSGYGLRVQVTSAAGAVNTDLDRFILGAFFGPAVAGGFELGGRLLTLLRLVPGFVLLALFPMAVSRTAREGAGWLDRFNLITTRYLSLFVVPGAAALMVCADPLVRLWLGHPVAWAALNIVILAPCYALSLAVGATAIVVRVEGRPGLETTYSVLSVLLNLALTIPLLHLLGPAGVPTATALAVLLSTAYFLVHFQRRTGRAIAPLLRVGWPPVAVAVGAGLVGALAAPYLPDGPGRLDAALAVLTRGGLTLLVATVLLAAVGAVGVGDRARLRTLLRRVDPPVTPSQVGVG